MKTYLVFSVLVVLLTVNVFGGDYIFVGNEGEILLRNENSDVSIISSSILRPQDLIRECMYSIKDSTLYVNIMVPDMQILSIPTDLDRKPEYKWISKRNLYYSGIFFDCEEEMIATSILYLPQGKNRLFEKEKFFLIEDSERPEKTKLDNCLAIRPEGPSRLFPEGQYKNKDFAEKNKKSSDKILKSGEIWKFVGQSKRWICYSHSIRGETGKYKENACWIKDKYADLEQVYSIKDRIMLGYVYPDVVLVKIKKGRSGVPLSSVITGEYYILLPNEEELRKIQMDPKAKHLWANSESVFFQLGKDILRVDYADGQKEPVKICEIEDELFCMFEKDNILAALAEDDKPDKKEKDKDKDDE